MTDKNKKIFIILGHPDSGETFSSFLADTYENGARENGHEIRRSNLADLTYDPILHKGYKEIQELEPDLITLQENINWADHVVIVYPNWWNTMPALLKGMFDRMWLPGFAFNFSKETKEIMQRLKGKTARVIIVSGTHSPWKIKELYGDYTNEIERGILGFSGFDVEVSSYGPCENCGEDQQSEWKKEIYEFGKQGV